MDATQPSSWPDLQPELLGLVPGRLPSLADRVRQRAVCQVEVSFSSLGQHSRTSWFKVFEADMTANSCHKWRRVSSLAGQALFVGTYSKSLPATECGLPQEDCIYFTCDWARAYPAPDPLRDSGVFNMRNGTITPLLPETTVVRPVCQGCPTWFFPSDAM
ncbi:hypothetical protein PAHAL_4G329600 [Panicum hallii]|uniref:KIB1-4 beta-propeller domain-containing protein n=1 Tax=Panicum hallii TaxID=206008 RepID=A0A2S3HLV9_9POAL|nr:uncharacterized protein LOC112891065 [Panicum hallii]PAN25846.1 hypothetical protein PAHAL_4G329600 [Panicum hallii]